jgi:hypothetical protein
MPASDDFTPDLPLPLFLSGHADSYEQRGSSQILKASVVVITATVIGGAIALSLGNPVKLFADVTTSQSEISTLRPGTDQPSPIVQSPAVAQASPTARSVTARSVPTRDEIAAGLEDQSQKDTGAAPPLALLKQFQAWAAEEDARAQVEPERPAQDARAQALQDARASIRHRRLRPAHNVRANDRAPRNRSARSRPNQQARVQVRSVQDARAQDQPEQPSQAPSFLQGLGWLRQ